MEKTRRRCFVHVGLPKTGTSFLQSTFWANRQALDSAGLHLLMDRQSDHFHATLHLRGMLDPSMDPPEAFTALARLRADAAAADGTDVLFTQESLAPATPRQARNFVEHVPDYDVHVIVTARDLGRQISSGWQQRVQQRMVHTYDDFLDSVVSRLPPADDFWLNQDLVGVTRSWASAVSARHVHVVTVPPPGSPSGLLLERFCSVLGVDPALITTEAPRANESLGLVQAELLRRVSVQLGDRLPHARAGFGRVGKGFLAKRILAPQQGDPPQLPSRLDPWCEEISLAVIASLREVGYPVTGDLQDLLPTTAVVPPQVATGEQLLTSAIKALADILAVRHDEAAESQELRAKVRSQRQRIRQLTAGTREPPSP